MSLILTEGFEDGVQSSRWNYGAWNNPGDVAYGRNGKGGNLQSGDNLGYNIPVADQHDTLIIGFAKRTTAYHNSGSANYWGFYSDDGATAHVRFQWAINTGQLSCWYGPTAAGVIYDFLPNVWYYVEFKARLHDTLGFVEVRVNGNVVFSVTGVDTKNGGTKTVFDHWRFSTSNISPVRRHTNIDDLYMMNGAGSVNNDFLGDIAIETLFPNGNGDSSDFVGSDGNSVDNYLLVDEAVPDYTDWVGGSTVGAKDLYEMQNPVRTSGPVFGAIITAFTVNGDSGPRSLRTIAKKGSTVANGGSTALVTTPSIQRQVIEEDFDTGGQLTIADIQALQVGAEITV